MRRGRFFSVSRLACLAWLVCTAPACAGSISFGHEPPVYYQPVEVHYHRAYRGPRVHRVVYQAPAARAHRDDSRSTRRLQSYRAPSASSSARRLR